MDGSFELVVGTAEFGNGTATVHRQIAATVLGAQPDSIMLSQSDTDHGGHDTGAFGSTGTVVAGRATQLAAETLRDEIIAFATERSGNTGETWKLTADAVVRGTEQIPLADLARAASMAGREV